MKKKRNIKDNLFIALLIIVLLLPLTGLVISTVCQIQVQQAMHGFYTAKIHIYGLYDLWNLTLLLYIPIYIWTTRW